jgi:iron complex transport system substrate-binding protein
METKRFVGIAIVLGLLFLVALPAIAAEEDDLVLGVYGNANEDDTIDMRDLTYVKLIFFGKKPETELADAKYDGKINPLDFIQIKLIIVGKESELTLVDSADRIVTVKKPIEKIVVLNSDAAEAVTVLGKGDEVVGIVDSVGRKSFYFPELSKKPVVGTWKEFDYEAIAALDPDLVISYVSKIAGVDEHLEPIGIAVVALDFYKQNTLREEVEKLGYILNKNDEAKNYNDWCEEKKEEVKNLVDGLTEEQKPTVFMEGKYKGPGEIGTKGPGSASDDLCVMAGGINIAGDLDTTYPYVTWEWVITKNPDVIIKEKYTSPCWCWDNTAGPQELVDEITGRDGANAITAVKEDKVFACCCEPLFGMDSVVGLTYRAKSLHPKFDLDPDSVYKEYVERFLNIEYPAGMIPLYPPPGS